MGTRFATETDVELLALAEASEQEYARHTALWLGVTLALAVGAAAMGAYLALGDPLVACFLILAGALLALVAFAAD
jgi:FtsH-binding integral membrane protein